MRETLKLFLFYRIYEFIDFMTSLSLSLSAEMHPEELPPRIEIPGSYISKSDALYTHQRLV